MRIKSVTGFLQRTVLSWRGPDERRYRGGRCQETWPVTKRMARRPSTGGYPSDFVFNDRVAGVLSS